MGGFFKEGVLMKTSQKAFCGSEVIIQQDMHLDFTPSPGLFPQVSINGIINELI